MARVIVVTGHNAPGASFETAEPSTAVRGDRVNLYGGRDQFACVQLTSRMYDASSGRGGEFELSDRLEPVPTAESTLTGVTSITTGIGLTCVSLDDGSVLCWGNNEHGQLGDGVAEEAPHWFPTQVEGVSNATAVVASGLLGTVCALLEDGGVSCWGDRGLQPDWEPGSDPVTHATPIAGLPSATDLELSGDKACVLASDKSVWCWSAGSEPRQGEHVSDVEALLSGGFVRLESGELRFPDRGYTDDDLALFAAFEGAASVARGSGLICAVVAGEVRCAPALYHAGDEVTTVALPRRATKIVDGHCALLENAEVWCWGRPLDALNPAAAPEEDPMLVLEDAVDVSRGALHACALVADTSVMCWGFNADGERGSDVLSRSPASPILH